MWPTWLWIEETAELKCIPKFWNFNPRSEIIFRKFHSSKCRSCISRSIIKLHHQNNQVTSNKTFLPRRNSICSLESPCSGMTSSSSILELELNCLYLSCKLSDCKIVLLLWWMSLIAWFYSQSGLLFFLTVWNHKYLWLVKSYIPWWDYAIFVFNIRPFRDTHTLCWEGLRLCSVKSNKERS